jgi:putative flippase GtrA
VTRRHSRPSGSSAAGRATPRASVLRRLDSKFTRYILFGSVAVALHLTILTAMVEISETDEVTASQTGLFVAIIANYFMQRRFTFSSNVSHALALPGFIVMSLVGGLINFVIFRSLLSFMHYIPAQCISILAVFVMNFMISNLVLFRHRI